MAKPVKLPAKLRATLRAVAWQRKSREAEEFERRQIMAQQRHVRRRLDVIVGEAREAGPALDYTGKILATPGATEILHGDGTDDRTGLLNDPFDR